MTTKLQKLTQNILSSQGKLEADFILRNAQVADVYTLTWKKADIVVNNGTIVALDHNHKFQAKEEQDAAGSYVIPGLIDGHIHIESSMLTPGNLVEFYYLMVLPQSSQIHMKSPMSQERKASNLCSMMHKKRIWIFL